MQEAREAFGTMSNFDELTAKSVFDYGSITEGYMNRTSTSVYDAFMDAYLKSDFDGTILGMFRQLCVEI
jgi:hypothetical protein